MGILPNATMFTRYDEVHFQMAVIGLIPARLESARLPRKALLPIDGLPIIVHTFKRSLLADSLDEVYVCTDSEEIADVVQTHDGRVIMTSDTHTNDTERIAEAADKLTREMNYLEPDLIVDVQGDEPLLDPNHIDAVVAEHMRHEDWDILVPSQPFHEPETPHVVKIIHDVNYRIISMSRAVVPLPFKSKPKYYLKHLDSISFRPAALRDFASLETSNLESIEGIELMRAIENGMTLGTVVLEGNSYSINVPEDYDRAKEDILNDPFRNKY